MTICVHGGGCLLGEAVDGEMRRNAWGEIVLEGWLASVEIRQEPLQDAFVAMPNHIHGVVWVSAADAAGPHAKAAGERAHDSATVARVHGGETP